MDERPFAPFFEAQVLTSKSPFESFSTLDSTNHHSPRPASSQLLHHFITRQENWKADFFLPLFCTHDSLVYLFRQVDSSVYLFRQVEGKIDFPTKSELRLSKETFPH